MWHTRTVTLVQTRLLVLNKQRAGEVKAMLKKIMSRNKVTRYEEALRGLYRVRRLLLKDQDVIGVRDKNHREVPIIVPNDTKPLLTNFAYAKTSEMLGNHRDNHFVLANSKWGRERYITIWRTFVCQLVVWKAQKGMHHYIALIMQVMQYKW